MSGPERTGAPLDPTDYPFRNPELSLEQRIDDLVARLTLEEKIECLSTNPSVPRLGIRATGHVEGLHGLSLGGPGEWGRDRPVPTTTFPQSIGLAATWDPDVLRTVATIESYETRYAFQHPRYGRGGLVVRAPNADLGRDPRWGRTEECYGEDPYFNGVMATAFTEGLQGEHPRYWRTASLLKHFLANSNEDERSHSSSDFDERLFREYYSVPFRTAIERGGSRAFMAAYNAHNGVPCTTHPMLRDIAIGEWGQDGIICTDGGAFKQLVTDHHFYPDLERAAAACIRAGITQFLDEFRPSVASAVEKGLLAEAEIDRALRGNFRVMIRLGLLDPKDLVPYAAIGRPDEPEPWLSEASRAAVREATRKSVVLLKNEGALLPLDDRSLGSIAVIGPLADRVLIDWYSGTPPYTVPILEGIRERAGTRVEVHASTNNDTSEAIALARRCDVAVVCVGNHPTGDAGWARVTHKSYGKEAVDRQSLELEDERLVQKVLSANPRTVLVLVSSFPYAINWSQANLPAIIHVTHNSQELGHAIADVLFGDYNPGGRLVMTWPRSLDHLPPRLDYDIRKGRTYMYFAETPLYPFGFGLSYTTFAYARLRTSAATMERDGSVDVSVDVTNTGARAGDEVVQLYVRYPQSAVPRPKLSLRGFRRISLAPGETRTAALRLTAAELAYWDERQHRFVVEEGPVEIGIGRSSAAMELTTTVRVSG